MRTILLLLLLAGLFLALFLLPSCGHGHEYTESWSYIDSEGGGVTIKTQGIEIRIDGGVHYRSRYHFSTGQETLSEKSLNGYDFGIRSGVFRIGERSFGEVNEGDQIVVKAEGVFVDGDRRGDTPADIGPDSEEDDGATGE